MDEQKSPKELYDEKRLAKAIEQEKVAKSQNIKRNAKKSAFLIVAVLILVGGGWALAKSGFFSYDPLDLCVQHTGVGMHIHPHLKIFVKGEEIKIPANIGVSASCMKPIHTHDDTGTLHLEFPTKTDVPLGNFFKIWEKQLSSFGVNPTIKVNGAENTEIENYIMRDSDQIELFFD